MSDADDPERWVEGGSGAPASLRDLLVAARDDVPDENELASVAAALGPLMAPPPTGGAPVHPVAAGASAAASGVAAKVVGLIAIGGALGGAWWLASSRHPRAAAPAPSVTSTAAPRLPPAVRLAPVNTPTTPAPVTPAPAEVPAPPAGAPTALRAVPAATAHAPDEAELLQAAQAALKSDPARALALTEEHKRRFPHGVLAQEREVIAIEALAKVDKSAAAKRAKTFKQDYPGSAHESKVGAAVEGE